MDLTAARARFIPANAQATQYAGGSVVYRWSDDLGRPCARGFTARSRKPNFSHYFHTEQQRQQFVAMWWERLETRAKGMAQRRAARAAFRHTLQTGDVLRAQWGWEQTNVDYFQVTKTTAQSVWVCAIRATSESADGGWTGYSVPQPWRFIGPELGPFRVSEGNRIKLASYKHASPLEYTEQNGERVYPRSRWTGYA